MTPLDIAHTAMVTDDTEQSRVTFYGQFASAELFLLLEAEPEGDDIKPLLFQTEQGQFVLAFDTDERLSDFNEGPAPYAAVSGRTLVQMLDGQPIGVGLNLWENPSTFLMPAGTLAWLNDTLAGQPEEIEDTPDEITAPKGLPEVLITAIDTRLAAAEGLARMAYLAGVTYKGGRPGHLLAFIDAAEGSHQALAATIREALIFSGLEAGVLDVTFFNASDPVSAQLARVGLQFDLPQTSKPTPPSAPGTNPSKPPNLR